MAALASLMLALSMVSSVSGLYFHIKENEERCFIEEIPDETLVIGKYKVQPQRDDGTFSDTAPGYGIHVQITDPDDDVLMAKDYEAEGRFAFTSHEAGEHTICLHTNSTRWFSARTVRVTLQLLVGESANDYQTISKKESYSAIETRLFQLISQAKSLSSEQAYQRRREAEFRSISHSTNERVLYWSIAQALVLVLTALWQVRHLKSFFEAKKLV
ncbi:uncharacterized protein MONBRDRAFT_27225 [Monosiga brevicollis MX1]|uniref:GOLD domain-containing protein n=1 Tax=Monosiga brevicollis TaxID=81824 RepID=A9V4N8_MONBE|nr:uncharacterized protein MONBRDRAFT_27225 [Monosiga brevicollis MX1]EDQ87488.1 predicted protein [Monosiga brevicollis MX1]|eukprot:XP_001747748.1 hypothetical protein [Monosiga brevicollis MX1]